VIPAEISRDGEEPSGEFCPNRVAVPCLVHPHKRFLRKIKSIGFVTDVSTDEGNKRLLPASHQFV
jgi:hypothetical protein